MLQIFKGALTYAPGIQSLLDRRGAGSTISASYCYGVWLKHLTLLWNSGMREIPNVVAEVGPGGSLGVGLAALLSGSNKCVALDVVEYANTQDNLRVFDELVTLFRARNARPTKGWPDFDQHLPPSKFPEHILTDSVLEHSLSKDRVRAIREAISTPGKSVDGISINYHVPWDHERTIKQNSIDLILSHSTMEHVENLERSYNAMSVWSAPNGWTSHQIDYSCHGLTKEWDGYRKYSELTWKILKGKRLYLINRAPHSFHRQCLTREGYVIKEQLLLQRNSQLAKKMLAKKWQYLSDEDRKTEGSFMVGRLVSNS